MSDNLRARIAAVVESQHVSEYQGGIHPADVLRLADAVIRELGLHVVTVGDFQTVIKGSYPKPLEES